MTKTITFSKNLEIHGEESATIIKHSKAVMDFLLQPTRLVSSLTLTSILFKNIAIISIQNQMNLIISRCRVIGHNESKYFAIKMNITENL